MPHTAQLDAASEESRWKKRLVFITMVVLLPSLFAAAMLLGALQLIGVPVWHTVESALHIVPARQAAVAPLDANQAALAADATRIATLTQDNQTLQHQLANAKQANAALGLKVSNLEKQVSTGINLRLEAQQEAQLLVSMDPAAAAKILSGLAKNEAAMAIASMAPSDSGSILSAINPALAAQLLSLSAKEKLAALANRH